MVDWSFGIDFAYISMKIKFCQRFLKSNRDDHDFHKANVLMQLVLVATCLTVLIRCRHKYSRLNWDLNILTPILQKYVWLLHKTISNDWNNFFFKLLSIIDFIICIFINYNIWFRIITIYVKTKISDLSFIR